MSHDENVHYDELPDVLTVEECSSYLHLHVKTIRAYIHDGKLRAARCGKYYHIKKQWITDFLNRESR